PHQGRVQREERRRVALQGDQAGGAGDGLQGGVVAVQGDLLVPPAVPAAEDVPGVLAATEPRVLVAEVPGRVQQVHEHGEPGQLQRAVRGEHRAVLRGQSAQPRVPRVPGGPVRGGAGGRAGVRGARREDRRRGGGGRDGGGGDDGGSRAGPAGAGAHGRGVPVVRREGEREPGNTQARRRRK